MEKTQYIKEELWEQFSKRIRKKETKAHYYKEMADICEVFQKDFFELDESNAKHYVRVTLEDLYRQGILQRKTINKKIAMLHSVCNWYKKIAGEESGYENPFDKFHKSDNEAYINPLKVPKKKELDEIVGALGQNSTLKCIMILYEYAGIKMTEVEELRKRDITVTEDSICVHIRNDSMGDERSRTVYIPKQKGGEILLAVSMVENPEEHLFRNKYGKPLKGKIIQSYYRQCLPDCQYDMNAVRNAFIANALATGEKEEVIKNMALNKRWLRRYELLASTFRENEEHASYA